MLNVYAAGLSEAAEHCEEVLNALSDPRKLKLKLLVETPAHSKVTSSLSSTKGLFQDRQQANWGKTALTAQGYRKKHTEMTFDLFSQSLELYMNAFFIYSSSSVTGFWFCECVL